MKKTLTFLLIAGAVFTARADEEMYDVEITWPMAKAVSADVYENVLTPVITTSADDGLVAQEAILGSEMFWGTPRGINGHPFALVNPNYQVWSPSEDHTISFKFTVKNGYVFKPTAVECLSSVIGTNSGNYDLTYTWKSQDYTILTEYHPDRNNESSGYYSTISEALSATPGNGRFKLTFFIYNIADNKQMAFSNVKVKGVLQKDPGGSVDDMQYGSARTIDVKTPGTFAQEFLDHNFKEWTGVDSLTVKGALNETDLLNIKKVADLKYLDLSEAPFSTVPQSWMRDHAHLQTVILPDSATTIEWEGFYNCRKLSTVTAANLTNISYEAFSYCSELTSINLVNAEKIEENAFYQCSNLGDVDLSHVTDIGASAFNKCKKLNVISGMDLLKVLGESAFSGSGVKNISIRSLTYIPNRAFSGSYLESIILSDELYAIGSEAFQGCSLLTEIKIPSKVISIGYNALNCSGLIKLKCLASFPPEAAGLMSADIPHENTTLYVPKFAVDSYRNAEGWNTFYYVKPLDEPVNDLTIYNKLDLNTDDIQGVFSDNPSVNLSYTGSTGSNIGLLTTTGNGKLPVSAFKFVTRSYNTNRKFDIYPTLLTENNNISAETVINEFRLGETNTWYFISLPHDVKVSDIIPSDNLFWVIRGYDGAARASNATAWKDLTMNDTMEGGRGYIVSVTGDTSYDGNRLTFYSTSSANKNDIFRSQDVAVPLKEHISEFSHNRSWNLIGNPYPAYYNIGAIADTFTAPITVWTNEGYTAYSPLDDDHILRPYEAFFVQRPLDADNIVFKAEGRQLTSKSSKTYVKADAPEPYARNVFDFNLSDTERARVVINPEAKCEYEVGRDAAKFFGDKEIEIYVAGTGANYAIDERPLSDGYASLGIKAVCDGIHTLSLSGRHDNGWKVILRDLHTGSTVDLAEEDYTFSVEAGENNTRFTILFTYDLESSIFDRTADAVNSNVEIYSLDGILIYEGPLASYKSVCPAVRLVKKGNETKKVIL